MSIKLPARVKESSAQISALSFQLEHKGPRVINLLLANAWSGQPGLGEVWIWKAIIGQSPHPPPPEGD